MEHPGIQIHTIRPKVVGVDDDGVLTFETVSGPPTCIGEHFQTGETLDDYGIDNLTEEEAKCLLSVVWKREKELREDDDYTLVFTDEGEE